MKKFLVLAGLMIGMLSRAHADFCPGCIQNSATPQDAQFNITSATIRGPLYVGSLLIPSLSVQSSTAAIYYGSGTYLTNLNAAQLLFNTVPSAVMNGSYPGITGIGVLNSGVYNASIIGSQYGGTGANLQTANPGSIPYFVSVGTMGVVPPGTATYLLQGNGSSAPSFTHVPQVLGTNITGIPMANLIPGQLPMNITVNDASISTVSAAKIVGDIPGNANNINGTLPLIQLGSGTLNTSNAASSITVTGITPGYYGGPGQMILANFGTDGRVYNISQSSFTVYVGSITPGPLPAGVTIGANQITAGMLGNNVIASSLNVTGVQSGTYGSSTQVSTFTVTGDGRLSNAGQVPIALPLNQLNNGTLPGGILVPAGSIQSGSLGGGVIASSVNATGIVPGTYGSSGLIPQITYSADGRATSATQIAIPSLSTSVAVTNADNAWSHSQTFFSSITVNGNLLANNLAGGGTQIYGLVPTNIVAGVLPSDVVATSVTIPYLTVASSVNASAFFGDGSHLTGITSAGEGPYFGPAKTFGSSVTVNGNLLSTGTATANVMTAVSTMNAVGFYDMAGAYMSAGGIADGFSDTMGANGVPGFQDGYGDVMGIGGGLIEDASGDLMTNGTILTAGGAQAASMSTGQVCDGYGDCLFQGTIVAVTSVTANAFFGDGSHLKGIPSTASISGIYVPYTGATQSLLMGAHAITQTGTAGTFTNQSSATASAFFGDGSHLKGISTALGNTISSSWTVTGAGGILAKVSSVTASAFFGDGSHLTGVTATIGNTVSSSWTVTGAGGILARGSSVTANAFFGDGSNLTGIATSTTCVIGSGNQSVLCNGLNNLAGGQWSTVSGGFQNIIDPGLDDSNIGGGFSNSITGAGSGGAICGGTSNIVSGNGAIVGGGNNGTASGGGSFVGGGASNQATGLRDFVGGGGSNHSYGASDSFVGGGFGNTASGTGASVAGGAGNIAAGIYSVAGGQNANAAADGAWAMADATGNGIVVTTNNSVGFYYSGGFYFDDSVGTMSYAGGILSAPFISGDGSLLTNLPPATVGNTISSSWTVTGVGGILSIDTMTAPGFYDTAGDFMSDDLFQDVVGDTLGGGLIRETNGANMQQGGVFDASGDFMQNQYVQDSAGDYMNGGTICDPLGDCISPGIIGVANGAFMDTGLHDFAGDSLSAGVLSVATGTFSQSITVASSATIAGQANIGYEFITNSCGAGVTTCTASCSANKVLTGGGCNAGVGLSQDAPNNNTQWGCTSLTITTLTAYAFCARLGN